MGNQWDSQKLKPLDAFSSFDKRIPITAEKMHNGFIVTNDYRMSFSCINFRGRF